MTTTKDISRELNEATEKLNHLLTLAERRLVEMDCGVDACISLGDDHTLWFGKHGSKWGLFVIDSESCVHVLCASRRWRAAAAHKLSDLAKKMRSEAQQLAEAVSIATRAVDAFLGESE